MSRFEIIRRLIHKHRSRLAFTYLLFGLEMLGSLMRPYFLGVAINDLVKGSYHGLIMLSVVHLGYLVAGTIRHMLDTRTYSAIYTSLVTKFLTRRIHSSEVSRLSAHSTLSKEFVDFLEFDLVYVIEAAFNLVGSLVLLCFYDSSVVVLCLSILLPVIAISYTYGKKMRWLNKLKNDELEEQVNIISSANKEAVNRHYNNLRKWQIRISDQEAWSFGIIELFVLIVIGITLIISNNVSGTTLLAGNIVGIYNYILKFVSGLDTIPYIVQRLTSLSDITGRISFQEDDIPETKQDETKKIPPKIIVTSVKRLSA